MIYIFLHRENAYNSGVTTLLVWSRRYTTNERIKERTEERIERCAQRFLFRGTGEPDRREKRRRVL